MIFKWKYTFYASSVITIFIRVGGVPFYYIYVFHKEQCPQKSTQLVLKMNMLPNSEVYMLSIWKVLIDYQTVSMNHNRHHIILIITERQRLHSDYYYLRPPHKLHHFHELAVGTTEGLSMSQCNKKRAIMSTMENELFDKFPRICHLLKYSCKKVKILFYLWIQQARAYAANYSFEILRTILYYKSPCSFHIKNMILLYWKALRNESLMDESSMAPLNSVVYGFILKRTPDTATNNTTTSFINKLSSTHPSRTHI